MLDRLFAGFVDHLTEDGVMYLALMSSNKPAYDKIEQLVSEGKITKEVVHTYYEERGAKSFEIFAVKPIRSEYLRVNIINPSISRNEGISRMIHQAI